MSLILDALKRAERERQADPPPPSAPDVVAMPGRAAPAPRPGVRIVSVLVFGGGLALAALLLWDAFRTPAPPAPAAAAPAEPPAQPVIKARPAPPPTTAVPGTEAVASLDDLSDEPELDAEPVPTPAPAAKKQKPVSPSAIATRPAPPPATSTPQEIRPEPAPAPKQEPTQAVKPAAAPQPAPATTVTPAPQPGPTLPVEPAPLAEPPAPAPAEIPPALTQPAPLRKFREMPPDYRADFPPLRVEIHVYEQAQARRFVIVNGRKYREGERMAEGPSLIEIVPEGMILEYRGEKVLYTLGR